MNTDLRDRQIRTLQAETIDDLANTVKLMHKISRGYNDMAKQKSWKENRTMMEIEKECAKGLTKLDLHSAALEHAKREVPKNQKRLMN